MLVTVRRLGLREGRKRNVPRQPRDFVWLSGGGGDEGDLIFAHTAVRRDLRFIPFFFPPCIHRALRWTAARVLLGY